MPASEILKIKEVQNKIQETNPTIFKNIHNAIEKPYVKLGNQLNYLSAGIIISVIILIIVVLYYKIKAKMTKFNKINFVFFWLSFFLIAGYQAFFTLKIALAPGVYQYADFVEEILPMLLYE